MVVERNGEVLCVLACPIDNLALEVCLLEIWLCFLWTDDGLSLLEELELLENFLLYGLEVLLVCRTDICENTDGRLYHVAERTHLVRLTDAGFKYCDVRVLVYAPNGKWHANLRVVTARRASDGVVVRKNLEEPFLDDGLSVASGDADDRNLELVTMAFCKALKGFQRVWHTEEI